MFEVCAHPTTDDFGVPEVNGSGHGDRRRYPERRGSAQDGADVPRILYGIENEDRPFPVGRDGVEAVPRNLANGDNSLRRLGFRGRRELESGYELGRYALGLEGADQRRSSRRLVQLGRDQRAANGERRARQLLDRAHTFGHEQLVLLTRFAALQVARQGQEFQL